MATCTASCSNYNSDWASNIIYTMTMTTFSALLLWLLWYYCPLIGLPDFKHVFLNTSMDTAVRAIDLKCKMDHSTPDCKISIVSHWSQKFKLLTSTRQTKRVYKPFVYDLDFLFRRNSLHSYQTLRSKQSKEFQSRKQATSSFASGTSAMTFILLPDTADGIPLHLP